ncbi:DUF1461 domain-containing protein [Candidatus Woesearchaeota archaeon]|nr:DUF1461 domain-containing protein [Candidatus Woesearchaeota archaeon]
MQAKKILTRALLALAVLAAAQLIFLANFMLLLFNEGYYNREFEKLGTYELFPDADELNKGLLDYYKGEKNSIDGSVFNEREKAHLADVKSVIKKAESYMLSLAIAGVSLLLIVSAMVRNKKRALSHAVKVLLLSSAAVITVSAILFIASSAFPQMFETFHKQFFAPGTYVFEESDALIRLYPRQFFYDFAYTTVLNSAITAAIILAITLAAAATAHLAVKAKLFKRGTTPKIR